MFVNSWQEVEFQQVNGRDMRCSEALNITGQFKDVTIEASSLSTALEIILNVSAIAIRKIKPTKPLICRCKQLRIQFRIKSSNILNIFIAQIRGETVHDGIASGSGSVTD